MKTTASEKAQNIEAVYPLSPLQQGMIFHTLFAPSSGVYIEQLNCRFHGELDVEAFRRACQAVVDRHSVLRTAFVGESQGELMQVVVKRVKLPFELLDWRGLSDGEQQSRLEGLQQADRAEGFKLARAPLMRLRLIRLGDELHHFVWSHHHLLLDGWSVPLVMREVLGGYEAFRRGAEPRWPAARPFRDYIAWLQRQDMEGAKAFWQRTLEGVGGATRLGLSWAQGTGRAGAGERRARLTPEESERVRRAAQAEQVTVNTLVQGAWALLLSRLSGEREAVYGVTVSGRPAELEGVGGMVGLFINSLPARARVAPDEAVGPWLRRLQAEQAESRQYEYSPLAEVQKWAGLGGGERLFESLVVFENYPVESMLEEQAGSLKIDDVRLTEHTNYPLTVVAELRERLVVRLKYDASQYDEATIDTLLDYLSRIITQMSARPDQKLADIELLTEAERRKILVEWNATDAAYPQHRYIHELIAEQAAREPHAVALVHESGELTYQELNRRANQLAHYLLGLGVGPESRVGVLLERSPEMVVSLLGVLKAGAAYVPLDAAYPRERLRYMIGDARLSVLLTTAALFGEGEAGVARVVDLEGEWGRVSECAEGEPEVRVSGESLAYLIYTSGSTGQPKGAMNTHAGILNRLLWMQDAYRLTAADRVLQKTPFSFDVSVWEFFWPLMFGARLVLAKPGGHQDSGYLRDLIREAGVTVLHFVPSMLQMFIEEGSVEQCVSIRQIISSGEALSLSLQQRVHERLPRAELDNLYGPTEAAVDVTRWRCVRGSARANVPIGRPIANVQMYVLDERMEPVPAGMLGELYIGGAGVGRGYWGRAGLTAERFVPHPHSTRGCERLYRTGDLGRHLSDGQIEYVGRVDQQVKVRGNRIELGEIEAVLSGHPGVREAVVCVSGDSGSDRQLVAYLVPRREPGPAVEELREHLRTRVPDYMIPALFVGLAEMPLTPNGKVDRRRLPEPGTARPELAQTFVAPSTEEERALAEVWAQVLRLERVGVHDNFFALGGDSIRSIQVRSLARKRGLDFTLPQLFQSPTIHALAKLAAGADAQAPQAPRVEPFGLISEADRGLLPDGVEDAYPLAMLQSGMLFHSEFNQGTAAYHNVTTYHLRAPFDLDKMRAVVGQVLARHPALRTSFDLFTYSEPLQLVHREVGTPVEVEDITHLPEPEQREVIRRWKEAEKATPFDWSRPPLIRFRIHLRSERTFQFSFAEHHAIVDGWSVATMLTELFSFYFSAVGLKAALPPPPPRLAYRDFIALERAALASEETERFWLDELKESSVTAVPRWPARYRRQEQKGNSVRSVAVSPRATQGLKRLAQKTGAPLKSILLAAHLRVLSLLSGQTDVLTGLVANGRVEEEGGERVLGLFLNTLPFHLDLRGGSWEELVAAAFAAEQALLPHRRYPMARLQKRLGRAQLFDTSFDFTHFHVYQSLSDMKDVLLEYDGYEETNFTLTANFALSLETDQIWLSIYYLPRELAAEQVEAIGGYYLNVLEEMAERPQGRYDHFSPLAAAEREELLLKWNDTARSHPRERLTHERVAEQAARQPEAVALVSDSGQLTYGELNRRANQLAHYLLGLGVGPESRVGVLLERSPEMVVSLLGVLKAGAAYVPLDPQYPQERLRYMIGDARLSVLLTKAGAGGLSDGSAARVVDLEGGWGSVSACPEGEPDVSVSGESLAYVIYTSGSTGLPKGVQVSHGALINFLHSMQREPGFGPGDSLMAVTSLSFDIAGLELYLPLLAGGRVVVADRRIVTDAVALAEALQAHRVTVMQATPTTWRMLVEAGWGGDPDLKILCGGEALSLDLAGELLARGASVWNMYGPTETTIWSTVHRVERQDGGVLIGRPIDNTQVYIVDERMNPLPAGATGELLIGGAGLARGYRNRPDVTADKFIPNPFAGAGGERLYRTGDVARYRPDGLIECLGRLDTQVKVHGYRIELGEIEAVLMRHERVREAVVAARADDRAGVNQDEVKRLVAYVILDEQAPPDAGELYQYLKERLPDYMLPTAFVPLDAWPLTPNGKVDRQALPMPEQFKPALAAPPVAPRNALEEELAGLWSQVLGVAEVGVFDNFFELGGDSILSLQLTARARQKGLQLRPAQIFAHPNVASLAAAVSAPAAETAGAGSGEPAAARAGETRFTLAQLDPRQTEQLLREHEPVADIYPLSPMQQGMFFNHLYAPAHGRGIEQISCRLHGALDVAAMRRAWEEVVSRHDVLRTAIAWEGLKSPVQVVSERVELPWDELDWSHLPAPEQESRLERLLEEDRAEGFKLARAPLMRLRLIRLGDELHHFVWSHHHLLLDGWSVPLVMREVLTGYEAFRRGVAPEWPAARPFRDYIAWLRQQDAGAARAYWERALLGVAGATRLANRQLHNNGGGRAGAGERRARLSVAESERVRRAAQAMQVTVNTLVQGAWAVVLTRHTGEREAVYGVTVSGRPAELEGVGGMVGLFINSLPARARVAPDEAVGPWLRRLQAEQAESRQYEYSPLAEVQKWAGLGGGERLFESLVVFENYPVEESLRDGGGSLEITHFNYVDPPQAELMLMVVPGAETLVRLMYDRGLFADETAEQILEHFRTVLLSICHGASGRVRDLRFPAGMEPRLAAPAAGQSFAADEFSFEAG